MTFIVQVMAVTDAARLSGEIGDIDYPQPGSRWQASGMGEIGDIYYPQPMPDADEVSQTQTSTTNKIHQEFRPS